MVWPWPWPLCATGPVDDSQRRKRNTVLALSGTLMVTGLGLTCCPEDAVGWLALVFGCQALVTLWLTNKLLNSIADGTDEDV